MGIVVPQRFGDPVEPEAHGDAAAKQHGEPLQPRELGLVLGQAQLEVTTTRRP